MNKTLSSTLTASKAVALWRKNNPEKTKKQRTIYWERLKNDPIRYKKLLEKRKKWGEKYRATHNIKSIPYREWKEEWKDKHNKYNKEWTKNNSEKRRLYDKKAKDKKFFGGLREVVIQRDNEKCVRCGMTREEHYKKYKRDITVDHKNRFGRGVLEKDNRLENMETLCISCHMRKDGSLNSRSNI
jgi:hypothetical protein